MMLSIPFASQPLLSEMRSKAASGFITSHKFMEERERERKRERREKGEREFPSTVATGQFS